MKRWNKMFDLPASWPTWGGGDRVLWVIFQLFSLVVMFWIIRACRVVFNWGLSFFHKICDPRDYYINGKRDYCAPQYRNRIERIGMTLLALSISLYFGYNRLHVICPWAFQ